MTSTNSTNSTSALSGYKRIVIKIGSALLVDADTGLKVDWLNSLIQDVAKLKKNGHEVLIVSSGSIALGRGILDLKPGRLKLEESQAAACVGQISLASSYHEALKKHGISGGQILLTLGDTEERRRYLNARETIKTLLKVNAVPIINENDSVATNEIRYGDNDRLAARVATMTASDLLILLSDIDGLYTAPPNIDPKAEFIPNVEFITPEIEAMAGDAGTDLSSGGMVTKIEAAKIATLSGTTMIITSGKKPHPISALDNGEKATWFNPSENPVSARQKWITGQLEVLGELHVDQGAEDALNAGKSLLPAGVNQVIGEFSRGDIVSIMGVAGSEIARGIIAYDFEEATKIHGHKSAEIEEILGYAGRSEMIHRDYLAINK